MKLDLKEIARQAMVANGFEPDFSSQVQGEASHLPLVLSETIEDLRTLRWSSIDNDDSRDLDQIEVCEALADGVIRVRVGVADVDVRVGRGTAIDARAAQNTTSVYTGVAVFPMLPEVLSTGLTSLNPDQDRIAIVCEVDVARTGEVVASRVLRAWVHNYAQLEYDSVSAFLENRGPPPPRVQAVPGVEEQLRLQDEASRRLKALRHEHGALELESREAHAVKKNDEVVGLTVPPKGRGRELIEDFMIAANTAMASFLKAKGRSGVARVVRTPKRWPRIVELAEAMGDTLPTEPDSRALSEFLERQRLRDPERFPDLSLAVVKLLGRGEYVLQSPSLPPERHFGLAVEGYSHSTAPNRRYADLVTQRLVKAALLDTKAPYSDSEISAAAARCSEMEHLAEKVERLMRKVLAAFVLRDRIGEVFQGIVTGASDKGTYVRLLRPPAEGRIVRGEKGLDVGDAVRVRLLSVEPERGFIDFALVKH